MIKIPEVDVTIDQEVFTGGNSRERLEWFCDLALGMFIHWGVDSPLGLEISHPMVGASERVLDQYENWLPQRFNPRRFNPEDYAELADIAGMKYCCFTAKHHSGFCMFDTASTSYNVMNSRYGRDITAQFVEAFRSYNLGVGLYFSPLDFHWLRHNGIPLRFLNPSVIPANNPGLMDYNRRQLGELLSGYGKIDMIFFDGPPDGLKEPVWRHDPEIIITRGEMPTPEQNLPEVPLAVPWESCHTLGGQWNWHPQMLINKTARQLVEMLIETRAKGGNLLLNVTPAPDGTIPQEQENLLRELGLWLFWHHPAIYEVRPYRVDSEATPNGKIWYTRGKDHKSIYAFIVDDVNYKRGMRREILLKSITREKIRQVELLGQNGTILEHADNLDVTTRWEQTAEGLLVSAVRCLRPAGQAEYNFPFVLKITLD